MDKLIAVKFVKTSNNLVAKVFAFLIFIILRFLSVATDFFEILFFFFQVEKVEA